MAIDVQVAQELLCTHLCTRVRLHERGQNVLVLETPFSFPDGDQYSIYIHETPTGGLRLSDGGETFMRLSYENDLDVFRKGTRAGLLDQVMGETGLNEEGGEFYLEVSYEGLSDAIFRFGQGLTQIYDLLFLNRARVASTFYEDLDAMLLDIVQEAKLMRDYIEERLENAEDYPIDYALPGKSGDPVFLFGVPGKDKARLTTLTIERLLRHDITFDSFIVFANQQELPRKDLARLTNVAGEMVSSLDAREDLARKLLRKVA